MGRGIAVTYRFLPEVLLSFHTKQTGHYAHTGVVVLHPLSIRTN
jgi:hypothetical protein